MQKNKKIERKTKTRKEVWDILEEKLLYASEEAARIHNLDVEVMALSGDEESMRPYRRFMIALIVSSGRDKNFEFLETKEFRGACVAIGLNYKSVRDIILFTFDSFIGKKKANFDEDEIEGDLI